MAAEQGEGAWISVVGIDQGRTATAITGVRWAINDFNIEGGCQIISDCFFAEPGEPTEDHMQRALKELEKGKIVVTAEVLPRYEDDVAVVVRPSLDAAPALRASMYEFTRKILEIVYE